MAENLPPQLQQQLMQFQQLQAQLQVFQAQKQQMQGQSREIEHALGALEKIGDDAPVYRTAGSLLMKTSGKADVVKELTSDKETLDVRLKSLDKQEQRLQEKYNDLQQKLQSALGRQQAPKG